MCVGNSHKYVFFFNLNEGKAIGGKCMRKRKKMILILFLVLVLFSHGKKNIDSCGSVWL